MNALQSRAVQLIQEIPEDDLEHEIWFLESVRKTTVTDDSLKREAAFEYWKSMRRKVQDQDDQMEAP